MKNIIGFFTKELTSKLLITISLLVLVRIGTFIPLPGIDQNYLSSFVKNSPIAGFVNTFSGDGTFILGLFTLNIFPYINASILMQVLVSINPELERLQKEEGAAGRRRITQITRFLSFGWALIQSLTISTFLKNILFDWNLVLASQIVLSLTAGSMIVMWISEIITENGIGNGPSLLIFTNIVSNFPTLIKNLTIESLPLSSKILVVSILFIAISGIVCLQEAVRLIPLVSSKELNSAETNVLNEQKPLNYIPLRLNQAGVMPIIFTATILVFPSYLINLGIFPGLEINLFKKVSGILYWVTYFGLILTFSSFYSKIVLNPKDISNDLRKMAVTIPGIRPGPETTYFLAGTMNRVTLIGALFLAVIATLPNIIETILNVSTLRGLGTTSLLISVGVIIDTIREIRSVVLSNIYQDMINFKETKKF